MAAQITATPLEALVRADFPDIDQYPAEMALVRMATNGQELVLGAPGEVPWRSATDNADTDSRWRGKDREIRAQVLRWLCVSPQARALVGPNGIHIAGARVSGDIDLRFASIPFPIELRHCRLAALNLAACSVPTLNLFGSWMGAIWGASLRVAGLLNLALVRMDGQLVLNSAQIQDNLTCSGGTVRGGLWAPGIAVVGEATLSSAIMGGSAFQPFSVSGPANLYGARIGRDLNLGGARIGSGGGTALNLAAATIKGVLTLGTWYQQLPDEPVTTLDGALDLRSASVFVVSDNNMAWPQAVWLNGFTYDNIVRRGLPIDSTFGLEVLAHDSTGATQPYRQLAKVLRDSGDARGEVAVLKEMERRLSLRNDAALPRLLRASIGYGYEPGNAIWGLGGVVAVGWLLYWRAYRVGSMVPAEKEAFEKYRIDGNLPGHCTRFSPLIYSLERTFPLVKLGQVDKWQAGDRTPAELPARPGRLARLLGSARSSALLRRVPWLQAPIGWLAGSLGSMRFSALLRWFAWLQALIGWLLALLFVAAISGLVPRT